MQKDRIEDYEMTFSTRRKVSVGAEKHLGVPISCLDHGFVYLVDYMGTDESIVQAARVSYGHGTKTVSANEGLIRYLLRNKHTTPFEMVQLKFHAKMPILVARQWVRHRTASLNEYSGRYSLMSENFYVPDMSVIQPQSTTNKQGREESGMPDEMKRDLRKKMEKHYKASYELYEHLISEDVNLSRELARSILPVANYTEWYWDINLHNLFHFLKLRLDSHAQYEIRVYADAMATIVKEAFPIAWKAFEDYRQFEMSLSRLEQEYISKNQMNLGEEETDKLLKEWFLNDRERSEFKEKLKNLSLI